MDVDNNLTNKSLISQRKQDHINICLHDDVSFSHNYFDDIDVVYQALPELNRDDIDVSTTFLGRKFRLPLIINSMTGGFADAEKINNALAKAAEQFDIPFALGSQRAMIENPLLTNTYTVKKQAPSVFLIGNIGITHVSEHFFSHIDAALKSVNADALVVHLNAAQEAVQKEGMADFKDKVSALSDLCTFIDVPVCVKEVGHGISEEAAFLLSKTPIKAIDVAGKGGTSWTKIEHLRNNDVEPVFSEVGIPTPISLLLTKKHFHGEIVASGGIRHSYDIAKSLMLGASICGISRPFLKCYYEQGLQGLYSFLAEQERLLKTSYFLVGAKNTQSLFDKRALFHGQLQSWYNQIVLQKNNFK